MNGMESARKRFRIEVTGVVQGVGFRPHVYRLATEAGLSGHVRNTTRGAVVEVEGTAAATFADGLRKNPPPLARIRDLEVAEISLRGGTGFVILPSEESTGSTHISPDVAVCSDCLRELADPSDRRFLYPFINCTNCGPRYTITRGLPYDRPNTTMAGFLMCPACQAEYDAPSNRRYHAQPNACPVCGPKVLFVRPGARFMEQKAVMAAIRSLRDGHVVAVKGLGGFHLAADATNDQAVRKLRESKRRSNKAFALMAPDVDAVRSFCRVGPDEERLLLSPERPVVILEPLAGSEDLRRLSPHVAPGTPGLGFMLPYTPLHELLFHQDDRGGWGGPNFRALVMTSGNRSEEPIVISDEESEDRLGNIAEAFLTHNRDIFMRVDDSVLRPFADRTVFIRRARGYVPSIVPLEGQGPEILACGADLKNTFALTTPDAVIVSQHLGDREHFETQRFFEDTLTNLSSVYRVAPVRVVHDLHPGYFSTRWAVESSGLPGTSIQHHYAHVASVMAEQGLQGPVIGVALDGSGYGTDGTVWGGEFLLADLAGFRRLAHFRPVPMPGGEAAARNPWAMALSYVAAAAPGEAISRLERLGFIDRIGSDRIRNTLRLMDARDLTPLTSGAGRLFEAVASLLGLSDANSYEGEAAMALEASASATREHYPVDILKGDPAVIDFSPTWLAMLSDLERGTPVPVLAGRFHLTVAHAVAATAGLLASMTGVREVCLSGGVFQNRVLFEGAMRELREVGLRVHSNTLVPPNDGGVSLGQAYLVRERMRLGLPV